MTPPAAAGDTPCRRPYLRRAAGTAARTAVAGTAAGTAVAAIAEAAGAEAAAPAAVAQAAAASSAVAAAAGVAVATAAVAAAASFAGAAATRRVVGLAVPEVAAEEKRQAAPIQWLLRLRRRRTRSGFPTAVCRSLPLSKTWARRQVLDQYQARVQRARAQAAQTQHARALTQPAPAWRKSPIRRQVGSSAMARPAAAPSAAVHRRGGPSRGAGPGPRAGRAPGVS